MSTLLLKATASSAALLLSGGAVAKSIPFSVSASGSVEIEAYTMPRLGGKTPVRVGATNYSGFTADDDPNIDGYTWEHHEIQHHWTVQESDGSGGWLDTPLSNYTETPNVLPEWLDANTSVVPTTAFVLTEGTYRISLWCVKTVGSDAGTTASATYDVTVGAFGDVYADADIYCFSEDDDFVDAPGSNHYTNWSSFLTAINTSSNPVACLFRGGETYTHLKTTGWEIDDGDIEVEFIGTYGTGRAILEGERATIINLTMDPGTAEQVVFDGLHFKGDWDATTETGNAIKGISLSYQYITSRDMCLVTNCKFEGVVSFDATRFGGNGKMLVVSDCELLGGQAYQLFESGGGTAARELFVLGTKVTQPLNSLSGGGNKFGMSNGHANRFSNIVGVIEIRGCFFNSEHGHAQDVYSNSTVLHQPLLRIWSNERGVQIYVTRSTFEGGSGAIKIETGGGNTDKAQPGTYIFDSLLCVQNGYGGASISTQNGGCTFRNLIFVLPNEAWVNTNLPTNLINEDPEVTNTAKTDPDNEFCPNRIYNNSMLVYGSSGGPAAFTTTWTLFDKQEANNFIHGPNASLTPYSNIDLTSLITWDQSYTGERWGHDVVNDTLAAAVADTETLTIPIADLTRNTGDDKNRDSSLGAVDETYLDTYVGQGGSVVTDRHGLDFDDLPNPIWAHLGDFALTYDSTNVYLENTSGVEWPNGSDFAFKLNRPGDLKAADGDGSPGDLPVPQPESNSDIAGSATTGLRAVFDARGRIRPVDFVSTGPDGNAVGSTGNAVGALLPEAA